MQKPFVRRCPKCDSTFTNPVYVYCLDDGTKLVEDKSTQFDPDAPTLIIEPNSKPARRQRVIKRQFYFSEGDTTREIAYPQLVGLSSEYLERRINNYLRNKFLAIGQEEVDPQDEMGNFVELTGYGVTLLTATTFSTRLWSSIDFGGAHPTNDFQAFNCDLTSGYVFSSKTCLDLTLTTRR